MAIDVQKFLTEKIEFNNEFSRAFDLLENGTKNIFITGKAGTGKSTLLKYFCRHTAKDIVILAPTGVAAINVRGQTIHSFFRFKPDITPEGVQSIKIPRSRKKIYQNIDTLIIDEISMVRADLLDCIDQFLRLYGKDKEKPFGGVQMVFFGDLYQLSPVVTPLDQSLFHSTYHSPYFFDAKSYKSLNIHIIELEKIYRQKEKNFIKILSTIRDNSVTEEDMAILNKRWDPHFKPNGKEFYIYLTTTNQECDRINKIHLSEIEEEYFEFQGDIVGRFENKNLPTQEYLSLKVGAQVMLLNNDAKNQWVNGSLGKIVSINEDNKSIEIELSNHTVVSVAPFKWDMFRFYFDEDTQRIESESVGSFTQFPLRLAWAVTIHKSQGLTFSKAIVDLGQGTFSHGQAYVALSRCSSLKGLVLIKPFRRSHIRLDRRIVKFLDKAVL